MNIIELNELSFNFMSDGYKDHLRFDLGFDLSEIPLPFDDDDPRLEPWIVWPMIHGEASHTIPFCIETRRTERCSVFSKPHVKTGKSKSIRLFSPINHSQRGAIKAGNVDYYLPDPWSDEKPIAPHGLAGLPWDAISRYVKTGKLNSMGFIGFCQVVIHTTKILAQPVAAWNLLKIFFNVGLKPTLALLLDTLLLVHVHQMNSRLKTDGELVNVIFLNGLAHVQHHMIMGLTQGTPRGKSKYERLVEYYLRIFRLFCNKDFLVVSGLSQQKVLRREVYWRLTNPQNIIESAICAAGFSFGVIKIERRMSRDLTLILQNKDQLERAKLFLEGLTLTVSGDIGVPMFRVRRVEPHTGAIDVDFAYDGDPESTTYVISMHGNRLLEGAIRSLMSKHGTKEGRHNSTCCVIQIGESKNFFKVRTLEDLKNVYSEIVA